MASQKEFTMDAIPKVEYCIPLELRDEQIKLSIKRIKGRVVPATETTEEPIAIVCFGPSLKKTWPQLKKYKKIISCSGAHKFLVEKGIIPTYHLDVDPRPHKVLLMGEPVKGVQYLMASCVHPKVLDHLEGQDVKLWHVFANDAEAQRILPKGEWAMTGGSSAGLRAMTMARFLGYKNMHVFGMDGNIEGTSSHAGEHPNKIKQWQEVEYKGVKFKSTASLAHCAKETFHELNQMPDVKAKFYGKGLVQLMAKDYVPKPSDKSFIGWSRPPIISESYRELNRQLHESNPTYGIGGKRHAKVVKDLMKTLISPENQFVSCLDFGCGKGTLAKELSLENIIIAEYDPAVPGKDEMPRAADLVVCTDVLEHIEPENLDYVLDELKNLTRRLGYFVISTRKAGKTLADGRNAHLIVEQEPWWVSQLSKFFNVAKSFPTKNSELHVLVTPLK